jgi:DNA invertase Pin-like site-specific DNA recombinase
MASLQPGDIVQVTKLDRLGRSTRELLDLIERISKAGASFRSLGDPLWDTSSSQGRLLSTLLAAIAEFERDLIKERTGDRRKRARPPASSSVGSRSCRTSSASRRGDAAPRGR